MPGARGDSQRTAPANTPSLQRVFPPRLELGTPPGRAQACNSALRQTAGPSGRMTAVRGSDHAEPPTQEFLLSSSSGVARKTSTGQGPETPETLPALSRPPALGC